MSLEITNRVEKSSLKTLDLDFFYPKLEIATFDIKFWLKDELLLIEKDFRKSIDQFNWEKFNNKAIAIVVEWNDKLTQVERVWILCDCSFEGDVTENFEEG